MATITRSRKIRPSSRLATSKSYKIDTKKVLSNDVLEVTITHESKPFSKVYKFSGKKVGSKDSIHFSVHENGNDIQINWSSVVPD